MEAAYGRAVEVAPSLRRVLADNPGPFTYLGTGTYIVGRGETAVIDPGPDDPAHLAAILRAVEGERVAAILVTHTHADHSPLAAALAARTGAVVWGLPNPGGSTEESGDSRFRPDVQPAEGARVHGPGWTLEALRTPGHASNHLAWAWPEADALFPGDLVMGWSTSVVSPPDGDMDAYMASLDKLAARRASVLYPTHGPPITEPAPFLAALREHRLARERLVLAALEPRPASATMLTPRVYAGVDARLRPAAARSLLAHLIRLQRAGRVLAAADPVDVDTLFALAG
ncbi:MAG: MBL fold metallo-hydrolase [Caulobacteraceae bacterium]|nr:MBL fold metallo-hydrolase [Caulobacter sp.]